MNRKFYWTLSFSLFIVAQVQAQVTIKNANEMQVFLGQPNMLINDYTIPLELAQNLIIQGKVRGEENQVLTEVSIKLVSLSESKAEEKNKVERQIGYDTTRGTFRGTISHTGTYLILIKKAGYIFHTQYIRVEDKTYATAQVLNVVLKKEHQ